MKKITTKQAFSLLRLITRMGIKDNIINAIKDANRLNKEKNLVLGKLYEKLENKDIEITDEVTNKLLADNLDLAKQLQGVTEGEEELSINLIADIIFAIPNAEKDFYKCMSEIYGQSVKEVEQMDIVDSIKGVIDIFKSPTFMNFFQSTIK